MTNNQLWALVVGVASSYGIVTTLLVLYINAKFDALDVKFSTSDAKLSTAVSEIKEHISKTMTEHLRLEYMKHES